METRDITKSSNVRIFGISRPFGLWLQGGVLFGACLQSPMAHALTLKEVQTSQSNFGSWVAAESPRAVDPQKSGIPSAVFRAGAMEEEAELPHLRLTDTERNDSLAVNLPASFDWRNVNGQSFVPPVPAQGECGACVSFAASGTLEMQLGIACNLPQRPFAMSKQYLHSCGGASCRGGWMISKAVDFLVESGTPDEACLPYLAQDGVCSQACSDVDKRTVRLFSYEQPTTGFIDVNKIKSALLKGPLLSSMILYEDLEFYKSGVYRYATGNKLGSHAVVIVGWSDSDRAWIVRNSWGSKWGEGGFFKAAWDDTNVLVGRYTWLFDVSNAVREGVCRLPR